MDIRALASPADVDEYLPYRSPQDEVLVALARAALTAWKRTRDGQYLVQDAGGLLALAVLVATAGADPAQIPDMLP